jgi:hypothetical protein
MSFGLFITSSGYSSFSSATVHLHTSEIIGGLLLDLDARQLAGFAESALSFHVLRHSRSLFTVSSSSVKMLLRGTTGVSVRLPNEMLAQVDRLANDERRTRGNAIRLLLEEALQSRERGEK